MDIKVLRNFVTVVEEQGITAAAELMRISQPALSRQIKDLEEEMGATLLVRGNRSRGLELTDEGRVLYRRAQEIVELADRTKSEINASGRVEGVVHIAAAQTSAMRVIARAAMRVREQYPDVTIDLHDGYGPDIVERLNNGLADFGVIVQPVDMSKFDHMALPGGEAMGLLMHKSHELAKHTYITSTDLKDVPLFAPRGTLERGDLSGWLCRCASKLHIVGTMNLTYNASRFVETDPSVCAITLGGMVDASELSDLRFRPFEPMVSANLEFAWKKGQTLTPAAQALLTAVRAEVAA